MSIYEKQAPSAIGLGFCLFMEVFNPGSSDLAVCVALLGVTKPSNL